MTLPVKCTQKGVKSIFPHTTLWFFKNFEIKNSSEMSELNKKPKLLNYSSDFSKILHIQYIKPFHLRLKCILPLICLRQNQNQSKKQD